MFKNKVPRWIRKLDEDSLDKELLTLMAEQSKLPIETPREMNFIIMKFKSLQDVDNAAHYLSQKGWNCSRGVLPEQKEFFFGGKQTRLCHRPVCII